MSSFKTWVTGQGQRGPTSFANSREDYLMWIKWHWRLWTDLIESNCASGLQRAITPSTGWTVGPMRYQIEADSELYNGCNSFACCNPTFSSNSFVLGLKFPFKVFVYFWDIFGIFSVFCFSFFGVFVCSPIYLSFSLLRDSFTLFNNQRLFYPKFCEIWMPNS